MRKLLFCLIFLLFLIPSVSAQDTSVSVTIYNQGTALVQDRRAFELDAGTNSIDFTDVAASIDPTSVSFVSLTDPAGTIVLEQNYIYDLVGSSALLERYLDEYISVTVDDGTIYEGDLLSGRGGEIILRDDDGLVYVISQNKVVNIEFPSLPSGLITRPTLRWLLNVAEAGTQRVELTYLTGGINWSADYILNLNAENTALDLNGWVTLNNNSGATFNQAQVKLVAGDVNRLPELQDYDVMEEAYAMAPMPTAAAQVEQREFFEYQLYEINRPVTIGDNETKQVEFVTGTNVPAHTYYVYNASPGFYGYYGQITDQGYGLSGITDVQNWLEFSTDEESGLGADLPAGRIRVYQEDVDGAALLIGENQIDHTPQGEEVNIYLGNAFDLVGERTQTDFQILGRNVLEETYEIRLRNRKDDEAVEIRVPETLFRWSNWEILNNSDEYTKRDSSSIEFRVTVEPGQEKVITYTVRYSWP
ncbi:MAG: DUF4139 domain-containing protein [Anaerolineae bacterium]|nr:DUF4139 domain-containing protein [Anaerolineae bacterium]